MTAARPDKWFTQAQIARLCDLMTRWRSARNTDLAFSDEMQAELESLVEAELLASALRSRDMLDHDSRSTNQ